LQCILGELLKQIDLVERVEAMAVIRVLAVEAVVLLSGSRRSTAENASDSARSTCTELV
jgi:hypothetical protein